MRVEREYQVNYRERGNCEGEIFNCVVTCRNKAEARESFERWDNQNSEWQIISIEKV